MRILVVDDDEILRDTLGQVLSLEGYDVVFAENGERALDAMRAGARPDLVLLDLMMPVMSGWEVLLTLEEDEQLHSIPVITVSAMAAPLCEDGTAGGVRSCLQKPVRLAALLDAVRHVGEGCRVRPSMRVAGTLDA